VAVTPVALPPGVLSVHALPSDHHDGPWDHIITRSVSRTGCSTTLC